MEKSPATKSFSDRVTEAKQAVSSVPPQEAADLMHACEPVVLIDPRSTEAIASTTGLIPGAKTVPLADIVGGKLPAELGDKWTRVITTCQAGPMAAVAAHELQKLGFKRVSYIEGGTQGWLAAGFATHR